ncbi:MAG: hypothetical protein ETSY1_21670 [Candidatus Entotheonella factor]|uniref:TIR domain-containing protein n=1 Tax=Entotheonella factor TaxID=1429438 RepID=W4LIE9_ENTF1|nr:MAG: hypothetical protein ETSY1_21670 [Candidatus Entotheonella factor]
MDHEPSQTKVFISYSREDKKYLEELLPALRSVRSVGDCLWYDTGEIDYGDKFHDKIQEALQATQIGILMLSHHFFASDYIRHHELPFLVRQAERKGVRLAILYVSAVAQGALEITVDVEGESRTVSLGAYQGFQRPRSPLQKLRIANRNAIYATLADWIRERLAPSVQPPPVRAHTGRRFELAIALEPSGRSWNHRFSLPHAHDFYTSQLDCPSPQTMLGAAALDVEGKDVFELLFGREPQMRGQLLGAAFDVREANPTRHPLRIRLLTDDRLCHLPWGQIKYEGRHLIEDGWTVEFHGTSANGFPEFDSHTCYFPGKVVLVGAGPGANVPHATTHVQDLHRFFQRSWPKAPEPVWCRTAMELRDALSTGSTRLVYYFGAASQEGLWLQGDGPDLTWTELTGLLTQSRSVSAVFLNLLGDDSFDATPQGRHLLEGAGAVLFQCSERRLAPRAARAGIDWLSSVFAASSPLDPVVALHRHQCGQVIAWTRYATWRTVAPRRVEIPDLVNLLLDRWTQRATILQAKEDFYTYTLRRIYQAVAMGTEGCRVSEFPAMASQHLRQNKREREVIIHQRVEMHDQLSDVEAVDDWIRDELRVASGQSIVNALLKPEDMSGHEFWFLVLGWVLPQPLHDVGTGERLLRSLAAWCRTTLAEDVANSPKQANIRIISILAIDTEAPELADDLEPCVLEAMDDLNDAETFHLGEPGLLAGVRLTDLQTYFRDNQICSCDDRYRDKFPRLLMGKRREMPFDEAVKTIRRGDPDNWGNLFETLSDMTVAGTWPPEAYDPDFWERYDVGA